MTTQLCACGEKPRFGQRTCYACHARYMRIWRITHRLTHEARKRANARTITRVYLKRGKLKKGTCEICDSPNVQPHHEDYSQPLLVRWFCRLHHLAMHDKTARKAA